jgi:hypothetical protein
MTDTPPMREQERERAEPEPGAQPGSIEHTTAGHSHRLTSGGEAVIYDALAFDSRPAAPDESSIYCPNLVLWTIPIEGLHANHEYALDHRLLSCIAQSLIPVFCLLSVENLRSTKNLQTRLIGILSTNP